jgi:hypothetical protein
MPGPYDQAGPTRYHTCRQAVLPKVVDEDPSHREYLQSALSSTQNLCH